MPAAGSRTGEHQAALELLEDYPPPPHPEIAAALSELRAALAEIEEQRRVERERIERQQRIAALLAEARAALREERFEAALSLLSKVEDIDPAVPDLLPLREQVRREEAAARLNAELARTLGEFDERLSQDDLAGAGRLAAGGRHPRPNRRAGALSPPAFRSGHRRTRRRRSPPPRRRATDRGGRGASGGG